MADSAIEDLDLWLPNEFPYEYSSSSVLTSPVDSTVSSTESDSDGDESLTCFTRRFSRSSSLNPTQQHSPHNLQKPSVRFASPESALPPLGNRSVVNMGRSPDTPFQFPPSPLPQNGRDLGLFYSPAGEVSRLKVPVVAPNRALPVYPLPPVRIPARACTYGSFSCTLPKTNHIKQHSVSFGGFSEPPWLPLKAQNSYGHYQGQNHSGFIPNAVHVCGSGYNGVKKKSACTGTGVFLPRRYENPTESRKKPESSATPPPRPRVSQIQNKNSNAMAAHLQPQAPPRLNDNLNGRRNAVLIQQKKASLPQEWTY